MWEKLELVRELTKRMWLNGGAQIGSTSRSNFFPYNICCLPRIRNNRAKSRATFALAEWTDIGNGIRTN